MPKRPWNTKIKTAQLFPNFANIRWDQEKQNNKQRTEETQTEKNFKKKVCYLSEMTLEELCFSFKNYL